MPFTPLHMGPGLAFKAALQARFSLVVFGWAQIVMDLQPLHAMVTGRGVLHGITHTYAGATVLAVVAALSGRYLGTWGLRRIRETRFLPIGWPAALSGALIGTWSHVLLDSLMHFDIQPWAPFASGNALQHRVTIDALHLFCLGSGLLGGLACLRLVWRRSPPEEAPNK